MVKKGKKTGIGRVVAVVACERRAMRREEMKQ